MLYPIDLLQMLKVLLSSVLHMQSKPQIPGKDVRKAQDKAPKIPGVDTSLKDPISNAKNVAPRNAFVVAEE